MEKLEHKGVRGSEPKKILLGRIRGRGREEEGAKTMPQVSEGPLV